MPLPPPDLSTREGLSAYRAELAGVARPLRWGGLSCVLLGVVLLVQARSGFPTNVDRMFGLAGIFMVLCGWALMIVGIVRRKRYHRDRMRGR